MSNDVPGHTQFEGESPQVKIEGTDGRFFQLESAFLTADELLIGTATNLPDGKFFPTNGETNCTISANGETWTVTATIQRVLEHHQYESGRYQFVVEVHLALRSEDVEKLETVMGVHDS